MGVNWVLGRMARRRKTEYEAWGERGLLNRSKIQTWQGPQPERSALTQPPGVLDTNWS